VDADLIKYFELRARDLGIVYTQGEPPRDLMMRVMAQESDIQQGLSDEEFPAVCFGTLWGGYRDRDCGVCQIQSRCLRRFATEHVPMVLKAQNLVDTDPYVLCKTLAVPPAAIITARLYVDEISGLGPVHDERPYTLIPRARAPELDVSRYRRPAKTYVEASRACVLGAEAASLPWPRPLPAVRQRPSLGLEHLYPPLRHSPLLARQRPDRYSKVWHARHARERARPGPIGDLPIGATLRRIYRGELIEIQVCDGHYDWRGHQYPTLYDAIGEVTGRREYKRPKGENRPHGTRKMSEWSAKRFFKHAFEQFEAQRDGLPTPLDKRTKLYRQQQGAAHGG
jgi:hypothetical protein